MKIRMGHIETGGGGGGGVKSSFRGVSTLSDGMQQNTNGLRIVSVIYQSIPSLTTPRPQAMLV